MQKIHIKSTPKCVNLLKNIQGHVSLGCLPLENNELKQCQFEVPEAKGAFKQLCLNLPIYMCMISVSNNDNEEDEALLVGT